MGTLIDSPIVSELILVTVIIPVYNRTWQALRAIDSVYSQSFQDFELIVVDDGSTEDIAEVEARVLSGGGTLLRQPRSGVSAARNYAALHASHRWLCFLDSDDEWLPEKLETQLAFHQSNPEILASQTEEVWIRNGRFVNPKHKHQKPDGEAFFASIKLCCISPSAVMISKELFHSLDGFDENMAVCEDYDLWLRLSAQHSVPLLREPLLKKHGGHADQLSHSQPAMDRFRIYSMTKLSASPKLSKEQALALLEEISTKSAILSTGAEKRGNIRVAEFYGELSDCADSNKKTVSEGHPADFSQFKDKLEMSIKVLRPGVETFEGILMGEGHSEECSKVI